MAEYYNFKEGLSSKGKLLTLEQIRNINVDPNKDYYLSIYKYNEEQKKKVDATGSVSGIKDVTTDVLVWDFDSSSNPENARLDTLKLAERLVDKYNVDPDSIQCYYSGSKGFHVVLPINESITPEQFKKATSEIASGLQTFDVVVSDPARVIRMEKTKHPKTSLYKIPIHIADIEELNIDKIKEIAVNPMQTVEFSKEKAKLPSNLFFIQEKKKKEAVKSNEEVPPAPKGWKPYKWAIAQGMFESGERHNALMVLAATCRALGYDKEQTYYMCKSALKKQARQYGQDEFPKEELWENIIEESIFSDRWEGGQYSPKTNPWLKKYCEKMGFDENDSSNSPIVQLHDIENEFIDYVENIDKNTILTGIPSLDKAMPLTVGMNLGLIGAASSGKTAICLKILKNTSDAGVVSVFASLDMRRNRLYEKLLYRVSGLSRDELYNRIKSGTAGEIFSKVREEYKNVFFYDRSCPSVEDIKEYILRIEESTGKKVKMLMVDYFERINAERSDETAASKEVAGKLQDLVNDMNICLITLVQPNKFSLSGGPDKPIMNYTAIKGSSYLYQAFRSVISIWRPFFTPETKDHDKFLQMAILKNDLGELDTFNFGWEGKRGEIWELAEEEEEELKALLDEKNNKQDKDRKGDWDF
jgi:hypothetical protein